MMDKTIRINLAGILFQTDEEAYQLLRDYLQAINTRFRNVPGGNETIDDIEARIAEIFQSQKGLSGIISKENVEAMMSIIGKPEDFEHGEGAQESAWLGTQRRRLYRNREDTIISGVCGGIGKVFYIFLRVILIIIGISFVLAGFATLLTFVLVFFFRYPGIFSIDSFGVSMFYLPDFLNFFTGPAITPWIMILTSIIVILPLLAIIYWGLKMIFWFRSRDWVVGLVALLVWILSIGALTIMLFNEGISFAESGNKNEQIVLEQHHDTLYLKVDRKISDLKYEKEISMPGGDYSLYINEKDNELFGRPRIRIIESEGSSAKIEVSKSSNGKTKREAVDKAESLIYNYRISHDTIYVDEYYNIPAKFKWTGAGVNIHLLIPEGTVIWFDKDSEDLFHDHVSNGIYSWELGGKYWIWKEEGLEEKVQFKSK
jgi:phage shock protein PspC (stress-responsive transcriptional regulator)